MDKADFFVKICLTPWSAQRMRFLVVNWWQRSREQAQRQRQTESGPHLNLWSGLRHTNRSQLTANDRDVNESIPSMISQDPAHNIRAKHKFAEDIVNEDSEPCTSVMCKARDSKGFCNQLQFLPKSDVGWCRWIPLAKRCVPQPSLLILTTSLRCICTIFCLCSTLPCSLFTNNLLFYSCEQNCSPSEFGC